MRGSLAFSTVALAALALAGCGVSYPADRQEWSLVDTPNTVPDASLSGGLSLFEASDVSEGARLNEIIKNDPVGQSLSIFWEGSWTGDKEGVELELSCTDAFGQNMAVPDCASATLRLSCDVVGDKLDCGDYVFQ